MNAIKTLITTLVVTLLSTGCVSTSTQSNAEQQTPENTALECVKVLGSNCSASQELLLREFLKDLDVYSLDRKTKAYNPEAPALENLPKDRFGYTNWIMAVNEGLINPRGTLEGEYEEYEGFLENLILFQVKNHLMADVLFPHGMHTYWLSCESCHPDPFPKQTGATQGMSMAKIFEGEYCGKCHGKVAFPFASFENCKRCHIISKNTLQKRDF